MKLQFIKSPESIFHREHPVEIKRSMDDKWEWSEDQRWRLTLRFGCSRTNAETVENDLRDQWLAAVKERQPGSFGEYQSVRANVNKMMTEIAETKNRIVELKRSAKQHVVNLQFDAARSDKAEAGQLQETLEFMEAALPDLQSTLARTSVAAHAELSGIADAFVAIKRKDLARRLQAAMDNFSKATLPEFFTCQYSLDLLGNGSLDRWNLSAGFSITVIPPQKPSISRELKSGFCEPWSPSENAAANRERRREMAGR